MTVVKHDIHNLKMVLEKLWTPDIPPTDWIQIRERLHEMEKSYRRMILGVEA